MLKTEKVNSDQRKQSLQKNLQSSQTLGWSVAAARRLQLWLDIEPKVFQLNVKEVFFCFSKSKVGEWKQVVRQEDWGRRGFDWILSQKFCLTWLGNSQHFHFYWVQVSDTRNLFSLGYFHIFMSFVWMTSNSNPRKKTIDLSLPAGSPRPHGPVDILPF